MAIKYIDIVATILLNLVHCAYTEHILPCNVTRLGDCPSNYHVCDETSQRCRCIVGYIKHGDGCIKSEVVNTLASHDVTAAVVSIFTIVLVILGLVLVIKKYHLTEYIRHKVNFRRNNDVMYEDVMIGQDDPPLVP